MIRRIVLVLSLAFLCAALLTGCSSSEPTKETTEPAEEYGLQRLRFETADLGGLGNSVSNLYNLGLVVGDSGQLYTVEYWEQDSDGNRAGMQIYVTDAAGRRCLTDDGKTAGYLNLTDSVVYYVNSRGISKIDRSSETTEEIVSNSQVTSLLLANNMLYYIASDALYSFDPATGQQTEIASSVMRGYLDFAEDRLFFCTGLIDITKREFSLCALNADGSAETLYTFDGSRQAPLKALDTHSVICTEVVKANVTGPAQYDLVLLNLKDNTQQVLVSDYTPGTFAQNGDQVIAASGGNMAAVHWLIDLKDRSKRKLPNWGGGALNFTADRLFAVDIADVRIKELIRKNDQFEVVPVP